MKCQMSTTAPFPHTADVGLRVWGRTRRDLFKNAASGLLSLLLEEHPARGGKKKVLRLRADDAGSLLVDWLHEVLFLATVKNKALTAVAFKKLDAFSLEAVLTLGDVKGARFLREIKAVTRHNLTIRKTASGFKTDIIFDI